MSETAEHVATQVRSGGCLCGKIRFTVAGAPDDPHICLCEHCQKRAGAPLQWWVGFRMTGLEWTGEGGEPTWFDTYPGQTRRGFCPGCGSHIAALDYGNEGIIGILVTALDDPDDPLLVPVNLDKLRSAAPWLAQALDSQHAPVG
jgi:hypothetical protein